VALVTKAAAAASAKPEPAKPASDLPVLARLFARRDLDGNGRIDAAEFRDWRGPDADLKPFDTDGDGGLDPAEFEAVLKGGK
jgi:Ca2+-binding EF-hand superfamily protein